MFFVALHCSVFYFFSLSDGETALQLLMGFLSFIGMVIMITYTVSTLSLFTIFLSLHCVVPENIYTSPTEGFFILTPHPLGISVPEGFFVTFCLPSD